MKITQRTVTDYSCEHCGSNSTDLKCMQEHEAVCLQEQARETEQKRKLAAAKQEELDAAVEYVLQRGSVALLLKSGHVDDATGLIYHYASTGKVRSALQENYRKFAVDICSCVKMKLQ